MSRGLSVVVVIAASGAASDVVASVTVLSQAHRTRGFVVAQSFQEADAIVEVLAHHHAEMMPWTRPPVAKVRSVAGLGR